VCSCENVNELLSRDQWCALAKTLINHWVPLIHLYSCCSLWTIGHPWKASFHFSFLILRQFVGLLGRGISTSPGRYLHRTTQTEWTYTNIHASSGIRIHNLSVRADEDSWCPRPLGYCDRLEIHYGREITSLFSRNYFSLWSQLVINL
jgi:hypothetical protein